MNRSAAGQMHSGLAVARHYNDAIFELLYNVTHQVLFFGTCYSVAATSKVPIVEQNTAMNGAVNCFAIYVKITWSMSQSIVQILKTTAPTCSAAILVTRIAHLNIVRRMVNTTLSSFLCFVRGSAPRISVATHFNNPLVGSI